MLDLLLVVLVAQQLTVLRGQLLHLTLDLMVTTEGTQGKRYGWSHVQMLNRLSFHML